jgi:hypothetical protein
MRAETDTEAPSSAAGVSHFVRILTPNTGPLHPSALEVALDGLNAAFTYSTETDPATGGVVQATFFYNEEEFLYLDRFDRADPDTAADLEEEIQALRNELVFQRPESAARWVQQYLERVRTLYVLELLPNTDHDPKFDDAIQAVESGLQEAVGGIYQSDLTCWANEDLFIVLMFDDAPQPEIAEVAVRHADQWRCFQLNTRNPDHIAAFRNGVVPEGVPYETLD